MCAVEQYLTVYDKHYEAISACKIGKHKFQASYLDLLDEFFEMAKLCDNRIIKVRQAYQGNSMIITIVM